MPDREKVIKGLECHIHPFQCNDCPYWDKSQPLRDCDVEQMAKDALDLLREQEPVKVVRIQNIQTNTCDWGEETEVRADFYCPNCKRLIASGFSTKFPYCPWCGRTVKWDA